LWPDEPRDVVYIQQHTTTEGAVANREEERVHLLPYIDVTAPVFQVDTSWLNADAYWNTARREKGATKKRKDQTHHTNNNKRYRFKPHQKQEQHVWDLWPDEPRDVVYIQQHTTTEGAVANREEERVHLLPYIDVTAPVFQADTSWLNAGAYWNTARREKGATKKRMTKPTTQTTTNKVPFQTTPKTRTTRVRLVTRRTSRCRIYSTTHHNGRRRGQQRGSTRVHLLCSILVTADTSQLPITPYGLPGVASEAAKIGQDPSAVSLKQVPTAAFKAALFPGANTAWTTPTPPNNETNNDT
jgi:hypothetical protein